MIDVRKINLVNMGRNELLELAKQEYNEFEPVKDYPLTETLVQRNNLKVISQHLQRYSFCDEEASTVKNNIEEILLSDFERQRRDLEDKRKNMSTKDTNNNRMSNAKLYANRYR